MSSTKNYGLYLTDDSSMRFLDWRNQMNGVEDSNMIKIDTALGEKANSSVTIEAILVASDWIGEVAPYMQEIQIDGLTAEQNGTIAVSHSASSEQRAEAREAIMSITAQEDSKLTVSADGKMPTIDIPITIVLLG